MSQQHLTPQGEKVESLADHDLQVLVMSGPSGSGKSTIVNRLIAQSPIKLVKMVSATTRPPRAHEVDGEDYYFLSLDEFQRRKVDGQFVEFEEVFASGYWYGTLKSELCRAQQLGGWAFLEIDVKGALRVMDQYPSAVSIFIKTASDGVFEQRLRARGTESEAVIQRRLQTAREELKLADRYRYQVCNDDLNRAVSEIIGILELREAARHV